MMDSISGWRNSHRKYSGLVQTAEVCSKIDQGDTCIGQNKSHIAVSQHITRWWHVLRVHLLTQVRGFQKTTLHEISVSQRPQPHRDLDLTSEELHLCLSEFWVSISEEKLAVEPFLSMAKGLDGRTSEIFDWICVYIAQCITYTCSYIYYRLHISHYQCLKWRLRPRA